MVKSSLLIQTQELNMALSFVCMSVCVCVCVYVYEEAGCVQILRTRGWPMHIIFGIGYSVDELRGGGVSPNPRRVFNNSSPSAI